MNRTWFRPARPRTAKRAITLQEGAGPRTVKRTRAGAVSVKVILAAVLRLPARIRAFVARIRVTRAGPVGLDAVDRVVHDVDDEPPKVLGGSIGGGEAAGLTSVGAGVAGVAAGADATGGVGGGETGGAVTCGVGGGGGSGAGGVVGVGSVTVGSETVIGGRPTWPSARADSTPAVAAAQKTASVRARVERRITSVLAC